MKVKIKEEIHCPTCKTAGNNQSISIQNEEIIRILCGCDCEFEISLKTLEITVLKKGTPDNCDGDCHHCGNEYCPAIPNERLDELEKMEQQTG